MLLLLNCVAWTSKKQGAFVMPAITMISTCNSFCDTIGVQYMKLKEQGLMRFLNIFDAFEWSTDWEFFFYFSSVCLVQRITISNTIWYMMIKWTLWNCKLVPFPTNPRLHINNHLFAMKSVICNKFRQIHNLFCLLFL